VRRLATGHLTDGGPYTRPMRYEHLIVDRDGDQITVTMNRPQARNALSSEHLAELRDAFAQAGRSDAAGVILAANGPVWSSGHDLREMAALDEEGLHELFSLCSETMASIADIPQVVVASVHALATAAGCQLAASCDLIVASELAAFATPGGKGGLFCHTPMVAVARQVGRKRAVELALTGGTIDAPTALEWGLVNRVVPQDELQERTSEFLAYATRGSRWAKGIGKQTLYAQMDLPVGEAYELATEVMSREAAKGDGREWPAAFAEKRDPVWTHTH
jgi:enoyl-CoA hydratase/carnithine racemase